MALIALPAGAHSLKALEDQIGRDEPLFHALQRQAPAFSLVNADGHAWDLSQLQNKVVVLNFIYANCTDFCPLQSDLVAKIQRMINATAMRDQVQFVSITTDPARDTAETLKNYGAAHDLDPINWIFLRPAPGDSDEATRELATRYGDKILPSNDGEWIHPAILHVIDREGYLRGDFYGLDFDPVTLVTFVNALVNDVHKPGEWRAAPSATDRAADIPAWFMLSIGVLGVAWLAGALAFFGIRRRRMRERPDRGGGTRGAAAR